MRNLKFHRTEAVPSKDFENIDEKDFGNGDDSVDVAKKEESDESSGKLRKDNRDDKLLHSKVDVDTDLIDKARVLTDAINNNISSFSPDLSFETMVNNYSSAKQIMGPTLIRELSGYDPNYVEKNIKIPEFQRELKDRIKNNVEKLKKDGLLDKDGSISEEGFDYSALSMLSEELDKLEGQGFFGNKESKKKSQYGERGEYKNFSSDDKYKNLALKQSIKRSIRRGHKNILKEDLVVFERNAKGKIEIVYVIDASGSMKGQKIKMAKKAGIALAYSAIKNHDKTGMVVFSSDIDLDLEPSNDFFQFARRLNDIRCKGETDIALSIKHAISLFSNSKSMKHIVLLSDALQTSGKKPEKDVLENISFAASQKISISVVGIGLNKQGEDMARKMVDLSNGSLYKVSSLDDVDQIVLEDYYKARNRY
ncbi:VWA domain-containing protein [Candidatus Woesearchaeota archaeon]|nr:VWA domain-containing protein [Candidatus Woesearchaeota archaeon]MCF7901454.1 VWA domain-containing protein [Candidatus Woesearchaeota archaeon]MCF8013539.1 VWA domain-containing protein [Candidatus Woesearchaeota archaeon]